jgi:deazaflavin-dependent oxidoreductase (nitroreductase family)
MAMLEVRGRSSGTLRRSPVVIATVDGHEYLVSILGNGAEWVKNVDAAHGAAIIRHGRDRAVHLVPVPASMRAPVLREYVRVATSGRHHFPVAVGAPLSEFASIAERYPVYRIDPPGARQ